MKNILHIISSDAFWFIILQLIIIFILLISIYFDVKDPGFGKVKRNDKNKKMFLNFWILISTVVLFSIFQISTFPTENKLFFYIFDLIVLGYLSIFNSWFTNKLVSIKIFFEEMTH